MNTALSETILYVTGKHGIENTSQSELESLIAAYPYFAPAQLVYATKLKSENSSKLQTQMQKTGLFFNNLKWLQYQMMEVGENSFKSFSTKDYAVSEEGETIKQLSVVAETATPPTAETTSISANTKTESNDLEKSTDFISNIVIPTVEDVKDLMSGINDVKETTDLSSPSIVGEHNTAVTNINEKNNEVIGNIYNATELLANEHTVSNTVAADELVLNSDTAAPVNDIHAEIAALKANWHQQHSDDVLTQATEVVKEEVIPAESVNHTFSGVSDQIANFKNEWNKPVAEVNNQPLPFETEPYYTIDYFASQGIKFDYSQSPQDKLTTKMLRFTDWLKKMKTVKPEQEAISEDPELDNAIQNIASMSNQTKEVVTETMAEIFVKQGKKEKAIQLYIKLSFLIPHKSAYFAAQIKELKGI